MNIKSDTELESNLKVQLEKLNNTTFSNREFNSILTHLDGGSIFHSHAMRKFFATTLLKNHVDSLSVHFLLGHSIDSITDAYMKADPRALKLIYMRVVEQLCFSEKLRYYDIDSDVTRINKKLHHVIHK